LVLIAAGVVLATRAGSGDVDASDQSSGAVLLALAAACSFGASLYATGHVSAQLPLAWALLPARLVGVAAVALPLALSGRLRLTRRVAPWTVLAGACEVGGFAAFAVGARHGIAISAVLSSQFATLAALAGIVLFRERLARAQFAGVAAVACGVAILSSLQSCARSVTRRPFAALRCDGHVPSSALALSAAFVAHVAEEGSCNVGGLLLSPVSS